MSYSQQELEAAAGRFMPARDFRSVAGCDWLTVKIDTVANRVVIGVASIDPVRAAAVAKHYGPEFVVRPGERPRRPRTQPSGSPEA